MTNTQIEQATGLDKSNVSKSLKWLSDRKIIFVGKNTNKRWKTVRINLKSETWQKQVKKRKKAVGKNTNKALVNKRFNVGENTKKMLVETPNTKEINKLKKRKKEAIPKPKLNKDFGLGLHPSYQPKSDEDRQNNLVKLREQAKQIKKNEPTNTQTGR